MKKKPRIVLSADGRSKLVVDGVETQQDPWLSVYFEHLDENDIAVHRFVIVLPDGSEWMAWYANEWTLQRYYEPPGEEHPDG